MPVIEYMDQYSDISPNGFARGTSLVELSWERWGNLIGTWLPYITLAIALGLAWLQPGQTRQERAITTLLAALAAAWVYLLHTRAPERRCSQPLRLPNQSESKDPGAFTPGSFDQVQRG